MPDEPLEIRSRTGRCVRFARRTFLAPMEGITDRPFRDHVIAVGGVGGACTEFVRISANPVPAKVIRRYLRGPGADPERPATHQVPVAVQLMAADVDHVPQTVVDAVRAGAAWIDLNFGCPAPVVFSKCAGSAMLDFPERLAGVVRAAVAATDLPVSAKLRAGVKDPSRLAELIQAVAEAGASMITLHGRLRITSYDQPATWAWIAEAAEIAHRHGLPLVGNGGVEQPGDLARLRQETGCDGVMVGRAALADPWIFAVAAGAAAPDASSAARFVLGYLADVERERGTGVALAKLKQLTRWYRAGGIFAGREDERRRLLRESSYPVLVDWYRATAGIPLTV